MSKYYLSFHTIFILNENIKWLDEFIIYYLNLGFNHFYLYDNEGTSGGDGTQSENKYGFNINVNNDARNEKKLSNIIKKYKGKITYIKWQPRDANNKIIYGQEEGIKHFIKHYGKDSEWVAFMDLDEFLFSEDNINIPTYLKKFSTDISCIKITQKKFKDRNLINQKYITQDYNCISKEIGFEWAPKNIIRCSDFINIINIHNIETKNKIHHEKPNILRFNHYNVNEKQLLWMTNFYNSNISFKLDTVYDGMKRYKHLFDKNIIEKFNNNVDKEVNLYIILLVFFILVLVLLENSKV